MALRCRLPLALVSAVMGCLLCINQASAQPQSVRISADDELGDSTILQPGYYRVRPSAGAWSYCNATFVDPLVTPAPSPSNTCGGIDPLLTYLGTFLVIPPPGIAVLYFREDITGWPSISPSGVASPPAWPGPPFLNQNSAVNLAPKTWAEFSIPTPVPVPGATAVPGAGSVSVNFRVPDAGGAFRDNTGSLTLNLSIIPPTPTSTPTPTATPTQTATPTPCSAESLSDISDVDSDQVVACLDKCPGDAKKTEPGQCGCGFSDTGGDINGTLASCARPSEVKFKICDVRMTAVTKFNLRLGKLKWRVFPPLQGFDNEYRCEVARYDEERNKIVGKYSTKDSRLIRFLVRKPRNSTLPPVPTPYTYPTQPPAAPPPLPPQKPIPPIFAADYATPGVYPTPHTADFVIDGVKDRALFKNFVVTTKKQRYSYTITCTVRNNATPIPGGQSAAGVSREAATLGGIKVGTAYEKCPVLVRYRPSVP
jgi:hypothetical protein